MAQPAATFPVTFDEAEVRRLCGPVAFARAAALQSAGHVLNPTIQGATLSGDVRGTWRRVEQVRVGAQAGRLQPNCSCSAGGLCRHAGALLLQWLRQRASFAGGWVPATAGQPGVPGSPAAAGNGSAESAAGTAAEPASEAPVDELARLLDRDTTTHLREITRRRGIRLTARNKAELIAQLAPALAAPGNVDAALATLGPGERLALDAVHFLSASHSATEAVVAAAFRALGGEGDAPSISTAFDLGLVVADVRQAYMQMSYQVPRLVAARLPALDSLARPLDPAATRAVTLMMQEGLAMAVPRLAIGELIQVVAQEIRGGGVRRRQPAKGEAEAAASALEGWRIEPVGHDARPRDAQTEYLGAMGRLIPPPPLLDGGDLRRLATRIGQPAAAADFTVHLLAGLGIVEGADRLILREDRLQALLELAPAARAAKLAGAWLAMADWTELATVVGEAGPLQLQAHVSYVYHCPLVTRTAAIRALIARLIGRLAPGRWYDLASFLETFRRLTSIEAPGLALQPTPATAGRPLWWLADRDHPQERLDLASPAGWLRGYGAIVAVFLAGPLAWLGLVDLTPAPVRPAAFRVRPAAGVLVERAIPADAFEQPAPLVVGADLTVLVPAGHPDVDVHAMLSRAGELVEASPNGLRYRLTAERVQGLFEAGVTGPAIGQFLAEHSGAALPEAVQAALDRWWTGYGSVRLYDELTLIELGDDYLLPELLATSPLRAALVHTFSPRLIAVDPAAVDELVAVLRRLGHAPRIVEEA